MFIEYILAYENAISSCENLFAAYFTSNIDRQKVRLLYVMYPYFYIKRNIKTAAKSFEDYSNQAICGSLK